jgi:hypothetical protein
MNIPLDEILYFDAITSNASTGAVTDADSTPTWSIFEEATDTPILENQNFTKRTGLTGNYRGSATLSSGNGFEVGKWYSVIGTAIVGAITGKAVVDKFRVVPAESSAGVPKVDISHLLGTAWLTPGTAGTPDVNVKLIGGDAQSLTDLKDFADAGYDPSTNLTACNVTHYGGTAGTFAIGMPAVNVVRWASSISVGIDETMSYPVVHVETIQDGAIAAATLADNTITAAKLATDAATEIATAVLTTQMTEAYAADGVAPTLAQAQFLIQQVLTEFVISGTTITVKKLDGSTSALTLTLNSATTPTSATRAT